jgi:hypothetical protein
MSSKNCSIMPAALPSSAPRRARGRPEQAGINADPKQLSDTAGTVSPGPSRRPNWHTASAGDAFAAPPRCGFHRCGRSRTRWLQPGNPIVSIFFYDTLLPCESPARVRHLSFKAYIAACPLSASHRAIQPEPGAHRGKFLHQLPGGRAGPIHRVCTGGVRVLAFA